MKILIKEILNHAYTDYRDKIVQTHTIGGKNLEDCFKQVYAMRRSGRYDSARRYAFDNKTLEKEFSEWKSKNETIEMFYGSTTVD